MRVLNSKGFKNYGLIKISKQAGMLSLRKLVYIRYFAMSVLCLLLKHLFPTCKLITLLRNILLFIRYRWRYMQSAYTNTIINRHLRLYINVPIFLVTVTSMNVFKNMYHYNSILRCRYGIRSRLNLRSIYNIHSIYSSSNTRRSLLRLRIPLQSLYKKLIQSNKIKRRNAAQKARYNYVALLSPHYVVTQVYPLSCMHSNVIINKKQLYRNSIISAYNSALDINKIVLRYSLNRYEKVNMRFTDRLLLKTKLFR